MSPRDGRGCLRKLHWIHPSTTCATLIPIETDSFDTFRNCCRNEFNSNSKPIRDATSRSDLLYFRDVASVCVHETDSEKQMTNRINIQNKYAFGCSRERVKRDRSARKAREKSREMCRSTTDKIVFLFAARYVFMANLYVSLALGVPLSGIGCLDSVGRPVGGEWVGIPNGVRKVFKMSLWCARRADLRECLKCWLAPGNGIFKETFVFVCETENAFIGRHRRFSASIRVPRSNSLRIGVLA